MLFVAIVLFAIENFELVALFENIEKVKELILSFGIWGGIVFALAFTLLRPLGFPNVLLALLAISTWSFVPAFIYCWLGQLGAQLVNFIVARYFAQDFIRNRLALNWDRYDEAIAGNSFRVILIGQLLFSRSRTVGWVFGLSGVRFGAFSLATVLGVIPWMLVYLYFTDYFIQIYNEGITMEQLLVLGLGFSIIAALVYRYRRVFRAMLNVS